MLIATALQTAERVWSATTSGRSALAPRTISNYLRNVRRLEGEIGKLMYQGIEGRLATWRAAQLELVLAGTISPEKLNGDIVALRAFYDALDVVPNPAATLLMVRPREHAPRPLARAVLTQLLAAASTSLEDSVFLACMYPHGMRISEVCGLHTDQLDVQDDRIHVSVYGKGRKTRVLPFVASTSALLAQLVLRTYGVAGDSLGTLAAWLPTAPRAPVFTVRGHAMSERMANLRFRDIVRRSGITSRATAHQFRHTTLTRMAEADVPILKMMAVSGHVDPKTLMRYIKVAGAGQAVEAIEAL